MLFFDLLLVIFIFLSLMKKFLFQSLQKLGNSLKHEFNKLSTKHQWKLE